eukprot:sb/3475847/
MILITFFAFLLLAAAVVGGLTFLWNWAAHETTAVFIGLNNKAADNIDGQTAWIENLADAAEEAEKLQHSIMGFYKNLMIISRPTKKHYSNTGTGVDLELGMGTRSTQTRDMSYKWSLPPIDV